MNKYIIGITSGDLNGIGLEVILKTLSDSRILEFCTPVIYASPKSVSYHKSLLTIKNINFNNAKNIQSVKHNVVNIITCWMDNVKINPGFCEADGGKYAYFSLEQAVNDIKQGNIDALVTAPINKKAMNLSGFEFPGHTEYFTSRFQVNENLMLMVNDELRVGLVTNHLPVSKISEAINPDLIFNKLKLFNETLKSDFGIDRPSIAVLGLNPHAGDGGVLGNEEQEIIQPAIEKAKKEGILAIGPYSADGLFGSQNYKNFDGILAMYHDQGLTPFKALSFGNGVNFTGGLPFIRTSPDHGTAFEIAGKNEADESSFREALYLAIDAINHRTTFHEYNGKPLEVIDLNTLEKNFKDNNNLDILNVNEDISEEITSDNPSND